MIEIEKFLQRCKLGQSAFNIEPYNAEKIDTEIGKICFYMKKCDTKSIIDFWKSKDKNEYLELEHPLYRGITTRAVFSLSKHIFFIDENNKHPWVLFQSRNIIDCILVENKIYTFPSSYGMIDFKIFNNLNKHNLEYRDIKFYFCLGGANFWHFFYEQLLNIYQITPERLFCLGTNYFTPLYHQRLNYENSKVLVYPHVISGGRLLNEEVEQDYPKLGNKIYSDSIQNYKEYIDEDNCNFDLIIWLSLVYRKDNKKTWLNQQDSILCIFHRLLQNIKDKKVKIYIDGFKAYENGTFREESNELMISQLSMVLSSFQFKVVSLHGKTMKEAISCCSDCHVAIAEAGSGGIIPIFCCNKPTILYGNLTYINRIARCYKNFPNVKIIEKDFINEVEFPKNSNQWFGERNYFIQWQHIYDLLLNMLINIKNIPIQDNFSQIQNLNQIIETKNQIIQDKDNIIFCKDISPSFQSKYGTAKQRIQNQLSYKLGQAMIANSKSILGYIRMPFVLSYIYDKHKQEQKIYQEKIKKYPSLKLPPLENYPDYKEALKEKECLTYKLGESLIKANKTWYKGGYVKLWLEIRKLKSKFTKK